MNKELFFICQPAPFEKGIMVYPPKCSDVIVNKNYNAYIKLLTYSQEEIEDLFIEEGEKPDYFPTPLEFLLVNCYNSKEYETLCKEGFFFFTHTKISFLYEEKMIIFGELEDIILKLKTPEDLLKFPIINESNFLKMQNLIREAVGLKEVQPPDPDEHPKIKAMKAKQRLRDRVKAKKGNGITFLDSLVAICCMGIGITPLNIGEMSYLAINSIIEKYQSKERYQLDIQSILAGGDSKKIKPKYWMEHLEN